MNMLTRILLALSLVFSVTSIPAFAQLPPKENINLPPTDLERIKIGEPAPDFTLQSHDGKNISLSDYRGKKNVVLVFYRGHW